MSPRRTSYRGRNRLPLRVLNRRKTPPRKLPRHLWRARRRPPGDVVPIEGGAPLETKDIAPEVMPDEAYTQPDALVPDLAPGAPPPPPVSFESAQEKARQLSIRYREVRVQAEKDPAVVSLLEQGERARTLEDQRAAMRQYYRLLFKKIASIDKSLAEKCKVLETAYLRRLAQERVEPTIPLNPPPTPEPLH